MKNTRNNKNFIFGKKTESGVALLFAMLISSIILAIALGIVNISVKEINFNTSTKSTNEAFFAADTGVECALYNDKSSGTPFADPILGGVNCLSNGASLTLYLGSLSNSWVFVIPSLGNSGGACAEVTVSKTFDTSGGSPVLTSTKIISKGYNVGTDDGSSHCFSSDVNRIERVLEVDY